MAVKSLKYEYPAEFIVPTNLESDVGPIGFTLETEFLKKELPIGLYEHDMSHGVLVTGSNSLERFFSNTKIVYESVKKSIPYIIITKDKKYRRLADLIPSLKIFRLGKDISISPLDTEGISPAKYIPYFIEMLKLAVNFGDEVNAAISEMLKNVYEAYGENPTMGTFVDELWNGVISPEISRLEQNEFNKIYKYLHNLLSGESAQMLIKTKKPFFEIIADAPALIEIDASDKKTRRFFNLLLLIKILTFSKHLNYRGFMVLIDEGDTVFGTEQEYRGRKDDPHFSILNWISDLEENDIGLHVNVQYPSLILPQILSNFRNVFVHRTHSFEESYALRSLLNMSFRPREEAAEHYSEKRKYQYQYEYLRAMDEGHALINRPDLKGCFPIVFEYLNFQNTHILNDREIEKRLKDFYPDWDIEPIQTPQRSAIQRSFHQYSEQVKEILILASEYPEIMYSAIQSATNIEDSVLKVLLHKLVQLRYLNKSQEVWGVIRRNTYRLTDLGLSKILEHCYMLNEISKEDYEREKRERGLEDK
ncbi:MAG: hypothetical protein ACTSRG_17765 [Candidatus Helarchaeota archaeon]